MTQLMDDHPDSGVPVDHRAAVGDPCYADPGAAALVRDHVDEVLVAGEFDPRFVRGFVGLFRPFVVGAAPGRGVDLEGAEHVPVRPQLPRQRDPTVGLLFVEGAGGVGRGEDLGTSRRRRPGLAGVAREVDQEHGDLARPRRERRLSVRGRRPGRAHQAIVKAARARDRRLPRCGCAEAENGGGHEADGDAVPPGAAQSPKRPPPRKSQVHIPASLATCKRPSSVARKL